jgi:hypothetical protein
MTKTITYHEFFKRFNEVSQDYHACTATDATDGETPIGAAIVDNFFGTLVAMLSFKDDIWSFWDSAFDEEELNLMEQLATTSPEVREGHNDGN